MKLDRNNNKNKLYIIMIVGLLFQLWEVDELSFDMCEDITINPNQFNFAQGKVIQKGLKMHQQF